MEGSGLKVVLLASLLPGLLAEGWGPWSPWAPCTRTCGEGLQARRRLCLSALQGCHGSDIAWKACGLRACPAGSIGWRDEQCALHNNRALNGRYHLWKGEQVAESPCSLDCRAVGNPDLVHRFSAAVEDGTICGGSGLQLCLAGTCEEVGCDLELRTKARLDRCGVCGGDGSSCDGDRYVWHQEVLSRCSTSCGGGEQMVEQVCHDVSTNTTVSAGLCNLQTRPSTSFVPCNTAACPARWEVTEYSRCKSRCSGLRRREVECVSDVGGQRVLVPESQCRGTRPRSEEPCTARDCPAWYTGSWSGCSVTCGSGTRSRAVECRNTSGEPSPSSQCGGARPPAVQVCHGTCTTTTEPTLGKPGGWEKLEAELDQSVLIVDEEDDEDENYDEAVDHTVTKEENEDEGVHTQVTSNPNFIVDQWSPCSASCGEGIRFRKVQCKIFLEFSKTVATLPDKECPGLKPAETDLCVERPSCGSGQLLADSVSISADTLQSMQGPDVLPLMTSEEDRELTYTWKIAGFTTCTASCLGGLQESIVICVEEMKESPVAPYFCDPHKRLEIEVRTCNENPCPPRWNVSDFSDCSKSCGGGTQARGVQCIQEVAHGGNNIISLGEGSCPQPPPRAQQFCNVIDCPVQWQESPWTKCSRKCGGGSKYRKVRCQQLLSLGQMIDKPEGLCTDEKPHMEEPCNPEQCVYSDNPDIKANVKQDYMQTEPYLKVLKLKVGGRATVYAGTTLKVRCPVKHYDKSQIMWAKGNVMYHSGRKRGRHSKVSVSGKGGLKIKTIGFKDSGVYTCMASKSSAKIEVFVKGIEAHLTTTEANLAGRNKKIWMNSVDKYGANPGTDLKHGRQDLSKYSKGKSSSHSSNSLGFPFEEKPVRREKWNLHQDDELMEDQYMYWDTIDGPVDDQAQPANRKKEVLAFVPWKGHEKTPKPQEKRRRRKKKNKRRKKGKKGGLRNTLEHALMWQTESWSLCSRLCGGGEQRRRVSCAMRLTERNITQKVPTSFCRSAGLRRPARVQECGMEGCPAWRKSPWSPCPRAECLSRDTGLQKRTIRCIKGHALVADDLCDSTVKPGSSQPCHNPECSGIWVLGEWSQCSTTCGGGTQHRSVSCEWLRGGLAPSAECGEESRPAESITCFGPPCRELWPGHLPPLQPEIVVSPLRDGRETSPCQDTSKFCGLIKTYKMCEESKFQEQCCQTCRNL